MTFTSQQFAKAFVGAVSEARRLKTGTGRQASETEMIVRAAKILKKSGKVRQIIPAIEAAWAKKTGAKKVVIQSALPVKDISKLVSTLALTKHDAVETIVDPSLIAGVIIKENDTRVLDLSFRSRVNQLFASQRPGQ